MYKLRTDVSTVIFGLLSAALALAGDCARGADPLDAANVVWTSPSKDHNGSMPIGNGDIGLNAWTEPGGDLLFYLSKTDAWSENCRLLKLGRVRVRVVPNPLADGVPFRQELKLRQGEMQLVIGEGDAAVTLRVWVDANRPVVNVEASRATPFDLWVMLEVWRTERRELKGNEAHSAYGLHGRAEPVFCTPDTVLNGRQDEVVWYHRNETSIWEENLRHQGMGSVIAKFTDPLMTRTFGGCIRSEGLVTENPLTLKSASMRKKFTVSIYPLTAQTKTAEAWLDQLEQNVAAHATTEPAAGLADHRRWWDDFWNRSWIRVAGPPETEAVTRGYALQRWISACAGRGAFPIKFNGTIFTVDGDGFDADHRRWGGPYWWQNTRLPYWPALACGDFDLLEPLFRMYQDTLPLAAERTRIWFEQEGAFLPETMYFWGMYTNANYGYQRGNLPVGELTNRYIRREYTASLELMAMMLDYYARTEDKAFLRHTMLPTCDALLTFWDRHYQRNDAGHLDLYPAQALETLQNARNPTPDVAGLHWVLGKLLALSDEDIGAGRRQVWSRLAKAVPPLPMGEAGGKRFVLGAQEVFGGRGNSENPELYAVFPFRLFGVGKPDLDVGRLTFARRAVKGNNGWRQDDTQAALLGLADVAAAYVAGRAGNKHRGSRFPAFWGPNMDWIPDQDHGGNLMMALQSMLMQCDDDKIHLLPAWPKKWDADFKLHAPQNTTVEAAVRAGQLVNLTVTPQARARDVTVMQAQ